MNVFPVPSAEYFCAGFSCVSMPLSTREYIRQRHPKSVGEGTSDFNELRAHLLRDVERNLVLAASQYRRSQDLMISSSASWAHVTLYYGGFYAAKAFLGMFGGWIDAPSFVEVAKSQPGKQELLVHRLSGSWGPPHEVFWEQFYKAVNPLIPYVETDLRFGLRPVNGNIYWLTHTRNTYNYDSWRALELSNRFEKLFSEAGFPKSLPGELNTQWTVTEALVVLAFSYAKKFKMSTDALMILGPAIPRHVLVKQKIFDVTHPSVEAKTKKSQILV
jgi:hypothetical protein